MTHSVLPLLYAFLAHPCKTLGVVEVNRYFARADVSAYVYLAHGLVGVIAIMELLTKISHELMYTSCEAPCLA